MQVNCTMPFIRIACGCGKCCIYRVNKINKKQKLREKKRIKAGVILNDSDNRFLLVESYGIAWGFPKGGQEEGETFEETAKRELKEETGLELEINVKRINCKGNVYFVLDIL